MTDEFEYYDLRYALQTSDAEIVSNNIGVGRRGERGRVPGSLNGAVRAK